MDSAMDDGMSDPAWVLTEAERRVQAGAHRGEPVAFNSDHGSTSPDDDGAARHVRAAWLADLLSGRTSDRLHPKGVDVSHAVLVGTADWQSRHLIIPAEFYTANSKALLC
jgi:hypothetical protein